MTKWELLKDLGITDRLLKFWVAWYKLPVNRRGRGSTYPLETIERLRWIKRLADSRYFTMRFVRELLRASQGGDRAAVDASLSLCRSVLSRQPIPAAARPSGAAAPEVAAQPQKRIGDDLL